MSCNTLTSTLKLLDVHYDQFFAVVRYAEQTGQPVPIDTRAWSQIIISNLTGVKGPGRAKGPDLTDGSDVKAAVTWEAIDTPRFNGCLKAGTKAVWGDSIESLKKQPYLFFVLWDHSPVGVPRCRIWVVRTNCDPVFRAMAHKWYEARKNGDIKSNNFQLHPPRMKDSNVFRNTCGNLVYPLLLSATNADSGYVVEKYDPTVLVTGECRSNSEK